MPAATFTDYRDLPPALVKHLYALEGLLGDLDGKTLCTEGTGEGDERVFFDEGTVVADDYVEHFNGVVEALRTALSANKGEFGKVTK